MRPHLGWPRVVLAGVCIGLLLHGHLRSTWGEEGGAAASRPLRIVRTSPDESGFSDAVVRESLARGNEFLIAQFKDGQIKQGMEVSPAFHQGLNALCVYALLNSGQASGDPRLAPTSELMKRLIENMKMHPMATDR